MKKSLFISFFVILFISCEKEKKEYEKDIVEQSETIEKRYFLDCETELINEVEFKACVQRPGNFTIKNEDGNVIYKQERSLSSFEFIDFDEDGYSDLILGYLSNIPGANDLLLFDEENNLFKKVDGFISFPAAIKIKNSDLYYSYHRSGCADSNWDSDLFKIYENKTLRIGNIRGIGCKADLKSGIYINQVIGDDIKLIKFIEREEGYWDGKWDFIEKYWKENYKKFE